jgi:Phosphoesterase family
VLTDIANGQLAQVSWIIPDGADSDHAVAKNGTGPAWVASIVNAIGNSPYRSDTAIIITWDSLYKTGLRLSRVHDFGSILKFIEEVFIRSSVGVSERRQV